MTVEAIKAEIEGAIPGSHVAVVPNPGPAGQHSLLIESGHAHDIAVFLRDHPILQLDFCSNVTGVDRLDTQLTEKVKTTKLIDGVEQQIEETHTTPVPGYLEVVYHLFSIQAKTGPVILRMRTQNRTDQNHLPSLTPVWRSAEFQEREIFDLYGIIFDGHPDLRRIFMWEEFTDHPMRKDYVPPADEEFEPLMEAQT